MSNQSLINFNFGSTAIRSIVDEKQEAWFVASDICSVLGYKNPSKTISDNCKQGGITKRYDHNRHLRARTRIGCAVCGWFY